MAIRAFSLVAAALSTGNENLANAAYTAARRAKPYALRRRAMALAALVKGGGGGPPVPPPGHVFLTRPNGTYLTRPDGAYLVRAA